MAATAETRRSGRADLARIALAAALITTIVATVFAGLRLMRMEIPPPGEPLPDNVFTDQMWPPSSRLEVMANIADGQAFVAIARDPLAREPQHFYDGAPELVYRAQRPLGGWLLLAASFGQPGAMPVALFVLTCLSVGALAAVSVVAAADEGKDPRHGAATVVLPGVLLSVVLLVPEPLPAALGLLGLVLWRRDHRAWAVAAFGAAVLGRELIVLVPLALALNEVVVDRRRWREVAPLALPVLPYALWVVSLRQRYGVWPGQQTPLGRGGLPFTGWISAIDHLELLAIISYLIALVLLVLAVAGHRRSPYTWGALAMAASTVVLGDNVLSTEPYRPMLMMFVLALIIVLPAVRRGPRALAQQR